MEILGYIAGTLTTAAFIPQAIKVIFDKKTQGISTSMYVIFLTGVCCWLFYGIYLNNLPIIIFNIITLALGLLILFNLIRYRKNDENKKPKSK